MVCVFEKDCKKERETERETKRETERETERDRRDSMCLYDRERQFLKGDSKYHQVNNGMEAHEGLDLDERNLFFSVFKSKKKTFSMSLSNFF